MAYGIVAANSTIKISNSIRYTSATAGGLVYTVPSGRFALVSTRFSSGGKLQLDDPTANTALEISSNANKVDEMILAAGVNIYGVTGAGTWNGVLSVVEFINSP